MLEPNDPVIESGDFLIATPAMRDANFHRTVILICDHDQQGTFGLVLNRSTGIPIEKVFEQLDPGIAETCSFFFGGPVDQERVFAVRRGVPDEVPGDEVGNGMFLPKDLAESVEQICSGDELLKQYRFFVGYSGWGAGQLESEISANAWLTTPADPEIVFDLPPEERWRSAASRLGIDLDLMNASPGHA